MAGYSSVSEYISEVDYPNEIKKAFDNLKKDSGALDVYRDECDKSNNQDNIDVRLLKEYGLQLQGYTKIKDGRPWYEEFIVGKGIFYHVSYDSDEIYTELRVEDNKLIVPEFNMNGEGIEDCNKGYDNGMLVTAGETTVTFSVEPKVLYRFRVCAVNEGGKSLSNQEVCAYLSTPGSKNILMVDGFQRVAGPIPVDNDTIRGFRLDIDPGVIDVKSPVYCGNQYIFSKNSWNSIGESGNELEGMILAGNTHDYCSQYANDIISGGIDYNISSCVSSFLPMLDTSLFHLINLIFGAQKLDGYSIGKYKPSRRN